MTLPRMLSSLLAELPGAELIRGDADTAVTGVEHDSRQVAEGTLFVAIPGFQVDGHSFLSQATAAGAGAVIVQRDRRPAWDALEGDVAVVAVDETRPALSAAAAWFYA